MRRIIFTLIGLLLPGLGQAQNGTPGDNKTMFCLQPYQWALGDDGLYLRTACQLQGYAVTFIGEASNPGTTPTLDVDDFLDGLAGGYSLFNVGSHMSGNGAAVRTYEKTPAGLAARNLDIQALWNSGYSVYGSDSVHGHHISLYATDIPNHYAGDNSLVVISGCLSMGFTNSATFPGSRWRGGYSNCPTSTSSDMLYFASRLNGAEGKANRECTAALTSLGLEGDPTNLPTVLAPVVTSFSPAPNTTLNGITPGRATFDCAMDTERDANWVVEGLPVMWGGDCIVENAEWEANGQDNAVTFDIRPLKRGQCIVAINLNAVSAEGGYPIDGNTDPYASDGVGPNRDSYMVSLQSNVDEPDWAFGCAGAWAFEEPDGTHILWVTDPEIGSQAFEVYGGPNRSSLLATIPAAGNRDRPHMYEVVAPKGDETFEVIEIDNDPETRNGSTRPFKLSAPPENLAELRTLNQRAATWELPKSTPNEPADPTSIPGVGLVDYVFYSSGDSLLEETLPLRDWLTQHGFTWQMVLDSPDPNRCRAIFQSAVENATSRGYPRVPFPVIVGGYNLGSEPWKNVVGTFVEPDSTGECYWGNCVLEGKLFDFDDDGLQDVPGTRLLGYRRADIRNQIRSIVEYLNGQNISPSLAFIMDGDLSFDCIPTDEPRATLAEVATLFQYNLIPAMTLHDSELPLSNPDCGDWAGRLWAGSTVVNIGITEMVGTGTITSWRISPAFIFQLLYSPTFNMSYLTRRQRIVAEFPGCGLGFTGQGTSLAEMFMAADPDQGTTAMAWLSHARGAYETRHLMLTERYFQKRFAGTTRTTHQAYFEAIRELGEAESSMRKYLLGAVAYGWPVYLRGMATLAAPDIPPAVTLTELHAAPNPFNPKTTLQYTLPSVNQVSLAVYNVQGQRVALLIDRRLQSAGTYQADWDGRNEIGWPVASGMYLATLQVGGFTLSTKLTLAK